MYKRMTFGIFIIVLGIFILLNNLFYSISVIKFVIPSILIAMGISSVLETKYLGLKEAVLFGFGTVFLVSAFFPRLMSRFFFPMLLIFLGIFIISLRRNNFNMFEERNGFMDWLDIGAIFSSTKDFTSSKSFRGANIVSVFGGANLNLSDAEFFEGRCRIDVFVLFGGVGLVVSPNTQIESHGVLSIFGGVSNKSYSNALPKDVVELRGFSMFGGIDVKNY